MTSRAGLLALSLASGTCWLPGPLSGQAVQSLGAEALIGTAGITGLSPAGASGMAPNPAGLACCGRWSLGVTLLTAPSTDVTEQAIGGGIGVGRAAFGLRLASRQVRNLFDDPILEESDLRVSDTDAAIGAAFAVSKRLRIGASALYSSGTALGASATGFGGRVGIEHDGDFVRLGGYYGTLVPAATWRYGSGTGGVATGGTRRLALAASADMAAIWASLPVVSLEVDRDAGDLAGEWVRASLGWRPQAGLLQIMGGMATEVGSAEVPTTYEAAVGVRVRTLLIYLGGRFGAEPAPGDTYVLGAVFGRSE